MIPLSAGNHFDENDLVDYIRSTGRDYIIEGKQTVRFDLHTRPDGLDYWLRENFAANRDTMQAEIRVRDALVETGLFVFVPDGCLCEATGELCNGLRLA